MDTTFNEVIGNYEKELGPLKAKALGTYFDTVFNELRGITDLFDGDQDVSITGTQTPYCFNRLNPSLWGGVQIDNECLNLYCPDSLNTASCGISQQNLTFASPIFEELANSEDKIDNYMVILETGAVLSHNNLEPYLEYKNIEACSQTSNQDLKRCLADSSNCQNNAKICLSYINCRQIYTVGTFPDNPLVDMRCLPFYTPTNQTTDKQFNLFSQNIYLKTVLTDSFLICLNAVMGVSVPFVNCFSLNLPKIVEDADMFNLPDMILFFKKNSQENQVYLAESASFASLRPLPIPSVVKDNQIFNITSCLNNIVKSDVPYLESNISQLSQDRSSSSQQINFGDCAILLMKWDVSLDNSTDLATEMKTSEFTFLFIKDFTIYKELQEETTFVSRQIVFFKLYVEVFLNQVLFILISKFGRKLVREFTTPIEELSEVVKDLPEPNTRETVMLAKINAIDIKYLELVDLKNEITGFGYLCIVNQMISLNDLSPRILEKALEIFIEKQNPDGIYVIYSHLVNYYLQKKRFPEATEKIEALISHLNDLKSAMTEGVHYNNDELTVVNLKLFYNYYRLINIRKKFLMMQEINRRPYWQEVMDSFRKLFSLLNEIEIKETIVLKLKIKKANIHFYLDKINHAEEAIMEAMSRYQEYVKHGKTPIHWSPDQKILCYLQQKLFLSCAEIKLKKNLYKESYDYFMKCLEFGPIYSPNLRSKCFNGLARLLSSLDEEGFVDEIKYVQNLSQFYRQDQKDLLFLLDSTKELNQNLGSIHRLIKDIFEIKMRPRDSFGIYCFSSELKTVQESITKRSIKGSTLGIFNQNYDLLKESANQIYRHPWDAISEALDIANSSNEENVSKYLVVFVFGDVVPLINRNVREIKPAGNKKMTHLWHQSVQDWQKRQSVYETLIEKVEDRENFVNIAILGYNLDHTAKAAYQKICEASKNGLFVNIDNEHPMDDTQELLDFF